MPTFRETFPARASEWALALMLYNWSLVPFLNDDLFQAGEFPLPTVQHQVPGRLGMGLSHLLRGAVLVL